jgi:uncharacterized integral membrane protein (TIGR00697 family)
MEDKNSYKYLLPLAMFYMTIKITTVFLIYKIVSFYGFKASASTLIIPLWFITGDIIAEIYGYKIARNLVLVAVFCQLIFAFICSSFASVASPDILQNKKAYEEILAGLPRVVFASCVAIVLGGILNAYAISRWKILLKGKYFALRSFAASAVGELIFTICAYLIEFTSVVSVHNMIELATVSYLFKLTMSFILTIPASIIIKFIKRNENISVCNISSKEGLFGHLKSSKITELFTDKDDKSYFREITVRPYIKHPLGLYCDNIKVSNLIFREFQPNMEFNWHNAPEEQYIIYLEGKVSVQASGGETKIFNSGDVLFARDLTGKGHITKTLTYGRSAVVKVN